MAVMEVPRARHSVAATRSSPDAPVATVDPLAMLEELFWTLDFPEYRVELLEGQIVVSPMPAVWHGRVVTWLYRQFDPVCQENGWDLTPGSNLLLPPTRDIIVPDQIIFKDPDTVTTDGLIPVDQVLLVAEVCSPSSIRADRDVKPLSCAKADIPLYLLVDRFTTPMSITLLSEPGKHGYGKAEQVSAGPGGGKLTIPAPFEVTLDASTLLEFRSVKAAPATRDLTAGRPTGDSLGGMPALWPDAAISVSDISDVGHDCVPLAVDITAKGTQSRTGRALAGLGPGRDADADLFDLVCGVTARAAGRERRWRASGGVADVS